MGLNPPLLSLARTRQESVGLPLVDYPLLGGDSAATIARQKVTETLAPPVPRSSTEFSPRDELAGSRHVVPRTGREPARVRIHDPTRDGGGAFDVGAQAFTGVGVRFSGHKKLN